MFFLTVTTLTAVFALMCVLGRVLAWYAPNHEKGINEYLSSHGVRVEGIGIRWSGLNPIVTVDRVEAAVLLAEDVELELDVFLSLWRNQFALSNLSASHVLLELDLSEGLASSPGSVETGFGALSALLDAQNLDIRFTSIASANAYEQTIEGVLRVRTDGAQRDVLVDLKPEGSCKDCGLVLRHSSRRTSFIFPEIIESVRVVAHQFEFDPHTWDAPYLRNMSLSGTLDLTLRNGLGKGYADFQLRTESESSSPASLSGNLALNLIKEEVHGVLENALFTNGTEDTELSDVNFTSHDFPQWSHVWVDRIDPGALVSLIKGFGDPAHPGVAWIAGLHIEGEIQDLELRHNSEDLVVRAIASNLRTYPYNAIPGVSIPQLSILGRNGDFLITPLSTNMSVEFPNWFEESRSFSSIDGSMVLGFDRDHLGVRLVINSASYEGEEISGSLGYSKGQTTIRSTMGIVAEAMEIAVPNFQQLVPRTTIDGIRLWLEDNIEQGVLRNVAAVYHHLQLTDDPHGSAVFEARVDLDQVIARFHEEWPRLDDVRAELLLGGGSLDIDLESCHTAGILVNSGDISVSLDDGTVLVNFSADSPVALLLDYVQNTPLSEVARVDLGRVVGSGQVDIDSKLQFLNDSDQPIVDVTLTFDDASLNLDSPSVDITQLTGSILYSTPFQVTSQNLEGSVFGNVGSIQISSESSLDESMLSVQLESRFTPREVVPYVGEWIADVAAGESDFRLNLEFAANESKTSTIEIESSLYGLALDLPDPIGKQADTTRPTRVRVEFEDVPRVHFWSGAFSSVFILRADGGLHGSVGLNVPPAHYGPENDGLLISGYLDSFKFDSFSGENGLSLPALVNFQEFAVNRVELQELVFSDVLVNGIYSESEIDLTVRSNELEGRASKSEQEPILVELNRIQLEEQESRTSDPFTPEMLDWIPTMNVKVDEIVLIDQEQQSSFGSWNMFIDVHENELRVSELSGSVKGLQIDGGESGGITWNTAENTTRFLGVVQASELQDVLPKWDYDPNVESEALNLEVDLTWPGSPLMFELYDTTGRLKGDLEEGRFLDVNAGGGALRIAGLLNFAVVLQRLRLDFKDVFREGTSFNRILFDAQTDKGILRIDEPLHIKTTGSDILLAGTMDLNADTLALEVVVTLPLSSSLPWWVGIATASPVALISALVGKKIFEGQLDRMASMKYRITGSLDDPVIQFVGLFRDSLDAVNEENPSDGEVLEGNENDE